MKMYQAVVFIEALLIIVNPMWNPHGLETY